MGRKKNQHIVPTPDGKWGIRGENNQRLTSKFNTQGKAIKQGKKISQNQGSELFIHGRNGKIRKRNSYGNDPFPPKG